jgi:tetratricopeptide (TPR) repeat protein
MNRLDKRRWLPAFIVFAALVIAALGTRAQAPAPENSANLQPSQAQAVPTVPPTPEQLGDSLLAHKRYQAAIAAFKEIPDKSAAVWNKLGIAHQLMFNLDEAASCYRKSLKLDKKNPSVWNNLGTVYDSQKDYRAAEKMYRKALKIEPRSPLILKNLGTELITQHKYKQGWEVYKAALEIDPEIFARSNSFKVRNPASLEQRGAMNYFMAKGCARAGLPERAIEYLRLALNEGYTSPKKVAQDSEFSSLRGIPAFEQLLAEQQTP